MQFAICNLCIFFFKRTMCSPADSSDYSVHKSIKVQLSKNKLYEIFYILYQNATAKCKISRELLIF